MIKVETIRPLGEKFRIKLSSLEKNYLKQVKYSGRIKPRHLVENALREGDIDGFPVLEGGDERAILTYLYKGFDRILTSSPSQLETIINSFEENSWTSVVYNEGLTDFGKKIQSIFDYQNKFRSKVNKGIWYAKQLNLKSCPYCNAQYTLVIKQGDRKTLAKFQFDHFFPKERYPYLALSMYNLVPSCASCNQRKSGTPLTLKSHYHPYDSDLDFLSVFHLEIPSKIHKMNIEELRELDRNELEVKFLSRFTDRDVIRFVSDHDNQYDITGIYERHKDIAHDLLLKERVYSKSGLGFVTHIEGLFESRDEARQFMLGNYMKKEQILERPLAKFFQDLANQLGL